MKLTLPDGTKTIFVGTKKEAAKFLADLKSKGTLEHTPRVRKILEVARDEAHNIGSTAIGSEHLLLALSRDQFSIAYAVLRAMGIDTKRIRSVTKKLLSPVTCWTGGRGIRVPDNAQLFLVSKRFRARAKQKKGKR